MKCLCCYQPLERNDPPYHRTCAKNLFGSETVPVLDYDYEDIQKLARDVVNQRLAIPGMQPKLSLTFSHPTDKHRLTIIGLWEGLFVLKPPRPDYPELPENESLSMVLANRCGLHTATHGLIHFRSGERAYLTRRFDRKLYRNTMTKLAQEDMCQLTGQLTENKYNSSLEKVGKAVKTFTTHTGLELIRFFEQVIFAFLIGDSDRHLKNYSLVTDDSGIIALSPLYDVISTTLALPTDTEETALTVNGKKHKITREDFVLLANHLSIPDKSIQNIFKHFAQSLPNCHTTIDQSFLSAAAKKKYHAILHARAKRLQL